jgi:hypothetical protein
MTMRIGGTRRGVSVVIAAGSFRAMTTDKPRSIVTYVHRPKRPPHKKAQAAITGPAIVTAASERDRAIRRHKEADDGQEASPEIKTFFARMMRSRII